MAGSLSHIVAEDGRFQMELIENLGDAHEALLDCFNVIVELSGGDMTRVNDACRKTKQPEVEVQMVHTEPDWWQS